MHRLLFVLVCSAGCGRIGFSSLDGSADAAVSDAPDASTSCTLGAWTAPVAVFASGESSRQPAISPDGLTIVFASSMGSPSGLAPWMLFRSNRTAAFSAPVALSGVLGSQNDFNGPVWSADGTQLSFRGEAGAVTTTFFSGAFTPPVAIAVDESHTDWATSSDGREMFSTLANEHLGHATRSSATTAWPPDDRALAAFDGYAAIGWPAFDEAHGDLYVEYVLLPGDSARIGVMHRTAGVFSAPVPAAGIPNDVGDPSITPDGLLLAFEQETDIYLSTRACE